MNLITKVPRFKKILTIFFILTFALTAVVSAQVRYVVIPESPRPGDPFTVAVNAAATEAQLIVNGRQVAKAACFYMPAEGGQPSFTAAILAIPDDIAYNTAIIRIINRNVICEIPITFTAREFRTETIRLTPELTNLVSVPDPQKTAESQRLWEILTTMGTQVYHTGAFLLPITSTRRTSQFGTRRVNLYSDGRRIPSTHAGVDFGAPTGTEVTACGRGMVILSRMRIVTGNTVIIEHAPGVYSIYYHLDSVIAQEGSIVEAGSLIALSGSTGFSTGPHLHWEIRVSTINTDPDAFTGSPLIDKELIISRIYN
ncbi:MAG: M23 family metallopeptidase [Treponema sp.]|jgi:murein DD-endopeptidase MepM/ murein hydrolase activator NlpD|nr:M23 family metallopeptidase [Treponema sp.]